MYRKILIGGVTAAAIVGAGGTALALSGDSGSTDGAPAATVVSAQGTSAAHRLWLHDGRLLRRISHGEIVVKGQNGFVTHDLIVGKVTAVSPTSISVRADDGTSDTFVVNTDTKVRVLGSGPSSIDKVATGDRVGVAGTGTSTLTAKHVIKLPG